MMRALLLALVGVAATACFIVGVPLPDPCANLCCPTCQCCSAVEAEDAYCSEPEGACRYTCTTPGATEEYCLCPKTQVSGMCPCGSDGKYDPCQQQQRF